jgi:ubiquitin C-terminal hydrolase
MAPGASQSVKLDTLVNSPTTGLDMTKYVLSNSQKNNHEKILYDLYGIIEHHGSTIAGGHYTAKCLNRGAWYNFNDSKVTKCSINTSKAYVLFYKLKDAS